VPISIDVHGLAPRDHRVAVSPLAELGSVLHVLAEAAHHKRQRQWISDLIGEVPEEQMREIRRADYMWRTSRADMLLPSSENSDLTNELDAIDSLSDEDWVTSALLTSSCGSIPRVLGRGSPLTDPIAKDVALGRARAKGPRQAAFVEGVLADPNQGRAAVRRVLDDCASGFFNTVWQILGPTLTAEARHSREILDASGSADGFRRLSASMRLDRPSQRLVVDSVQSASVSAVSTGTTLIPTVFGDPHLLVVHSPGSIPVIQYPVPNGAPTPSTSATEVQNRLRALDNPMRFRIARSIARSPRTTIELANLCGITAPEVSRHLSILKNVGLAVPIRYGRYVSYSLDTSLLERLGNDIISAFLL
jgi:DNA-binding transcriptional ArsR family regulator